MACGATAEGDQMASNPQEVYRPCHCGSGKKYKFCCRDRERDRARSSSEREVAITAPDGTPAIVPAPVAAFLAFKEGEELLGEGLFHKAMGRFRDAIRLEPKEPPFYNDLALAQFLAGEIEDAARTCEQVLRDVAPDNVFSLASLVHYYLVLGRGEDAIAMSDRLRKHSPHEETGLVKKCEALARMRDHGAVLEAAEAGLERFPKAGGVAFFAGAAAANLGDRDRARRHLRRARRDEIHGDRAREYERLLEKGGAPRTIEGDWPYLESSEWVSERLIERIKGDETARRYPGLVDALVAFINDETERAGLSIELLGIIGTPRAAEVLRKIAFGTFGPDGIRTQALMALQQTGAIDEQGSHRVWQDGQWREIVLTSFEVTEEAGSPFPAEHDKALKRMLAALRSRKWKRALRIGEGLRSKAPDSPMIHHNLAIARQMLGRVDEAESLLRRAIDLDPTYIFAPASLILLLLERERVDEAEKVLQGVRVPPKVHPHAYAHYLGATAELALARGKTDLLESTLDVLEDLAIEADILGESATGVARHAARSFALLVDRQHRRREAERTRPLPAEPSLQECLDPYPAVQLRLMTKALDLPGATMMSKEIFRDAIIDALRRPEVVSAAVRSLPRDARSGLADVIAAGGSMPLEEFRRRHGTDGDDFPVWHRRLSGSPLSSLKSLGLLAEGAIGGEPSVVIPAEVRGAVP